MERLKMMKDSLMAQAQSQMGNLSKVNAKELGEVVDMIKDLEEAIYYCSVVKAMEDNKEENGQREFYTEVKPYDKIHPYEYYQERDRRGGSMYNRPYYYDGPGMSSNNSNRGYNNMTNYSDNIPIHDYREGRSPLSRRMYMESKELNKDKAIQMKELEKYMKELSTDITEVIEDATPEERMVLKQKLSALAEKVK